MLINGKSLTLGYSPWGNYEGAIEPFDEVFDHSKNIKTEGFKDVDCIVLWGGTDVHPSYYNEPHHPSSGAPALPSERDIFEWKSMLYAKKHNIPVIGVCRGAQFVCVGAGGTLVQDCYGHGVSHNMDTIKGQCFTVTSSHHQMMNPYNIEHTLIGWSDPHKCGSFENGWSEKIKEMYKKPEPEIVYFPQLRGLAIQGHPEWAGATNIFRNFVNELIVEYLFTGG